jgi:hypothetical protein
VNLKLEAERSLAKAEAANKIQSDGPTLAREKPLTALRNLQIIVGNRLLYLNMQ